jgi:hypothetical protein
VLAKLERKPIEAPAQVRILAEGTTVGAELEAEAGRELQARRLRLAALPMGRSDRVGDEDRGSC